MEGEKLIGVGFVILFAVGRFTTPEKHRFSTTISYYYMSMAFYLSLTITFYACLVYALDKSPEKVYHFLDIPNENANFPVSSYLAAALIWTTLLPNIKRLQAIDNWTRKTAWRIAGIPHAYLRLSMIIRSAYFKIPDAELTDVLDAMEKKGFNKEDYYSDKTGDTFRQFAKIYFLMQKLNDWRHSNTRMQPFMNFFSADFIIMQEEYKTLSERARSTLRALHLDLENNPEAQSPNVVKLAFAAQCNERLNRIADFIAKGVLYSENNNIRQEEILNCFGFRNVKNLGGSLPGNIIASAFMIVFFLLFGMAAFATGEVLAIAAQMKIAVFMCAAVAITIIVKANTPDDDIYITKNRPVGAYIATGFLAVISVFFFKGVFHSIAPITSEDLATFLLGEQYWIPYFFALSFTLSFLCDNHAFRRHKEPYILHCFEGFILGLVLSLVSFLSSLQGPEHSPHGVAFILGNFGVGFLFGFFLPRWFRRNRYQTPAERFAMKVAKQHRSLVSEFKTFPSQDGENAILSVAALVAAADKRLVQSEIDYTMEFFTCFIHQRLISAQRDILRTSLVKKAEALIANDQTERNKCINDLRNVKDHKSFAILIAYLSVDIALADKILDESEEEVLSTIFATLEVDQTEFTAELELFERVNKWFPKIRKRYPSPQ